MLGIQFLINGRKRTGVEYIDFQNPDFRDKLNPIILASIKDPQTKPVIESSIAETILDVIEEFTGFKNITIKMIPEANFMINTGYMSPNNVLNIKNIEEWFDVTDSTLSMWYGRVKNKLFKGSIDYKTGKVYGAYAEMPLTLYIGKPVYEIFSAKEITKLKTTIEDVVGACLTHEFGHAFSACAAIDQAASDNSIIRAALNMLVKASTTEKRVTILRDAASILKAETEPKDDLPDVANKTPEEITLYFNALITRRNTRRALSVGVAEMSSEVIADMYSIRMGYDRALVTGVYIFSKTRVSEIMKATTICVFWIFGIVLYATWTISVATLAITAVFSLTIFGLIYASMSYSGTYNSPFRRFEDGIRQLIAKLRTADMPDKEKAELASFIQGMLKKCEELKPYISGTVLDRMIGVMYSGKDFRYQEFEHFTQAIANSELEVLNTQLKGLSA